jgi:hypothetical protein
MRFFLGFIVKLCLIAFLFAVATCYSQAESPSETKPFLVFENTKSPDGRYAVAWGLPKHPDVWAKVCQFEGEHPLDSELTDEAEKQANDIFEGVNDVDVAKDVENYIVDLQEAKIIAKLDCSRGTSDSMPNYFVAGNLRPNRHNLEVVWSRAGDLILANHTYRWDCITFCALQVRDGKAGPAVDLRKKADEAVRNFVAKSFPRHFQYSKKDLNICFSDVRQLGDTKFSTHVEAVVEKYWSSDGTTVDFALKASGENKLTLTVLGVRAAEKLGGQTDRRHSIVNQRTPR